MKTILVLTDLSEKAENAAIFALKFAEKIKANIILYHSFEKFEALNLPEAGAWAYEDYSLARSESLTELKKLQDILETHHHSGDFKPDITLLNEMGYDLGTNANELVNQKHIDLIIMGAKSDDTFSHLFYGSDACGVMEHACCPVMYIPENWTYKHFKTIILSNDLKSDYAYALGFLTEMARIDNSHILIAHFGADNLDPDRCLNLIKNQLHYHNVTFRQIAGKNIEGLLHDLVNSVNADLTVMIHHRRTQLEKLIEPSKSKKMLNYHLPLLVLPG